MQGRLIFDQHWVSNVGMLWTVTSVRVIPLHANFICNRLFYGSQKLYYVPSFVHSEVGFGGRT